MFYDCAHISHAEYRESPRASGQSFCVNLLSVLLHSPLHILFLIRIGLRD